MSTELKSLFHLQKTGKIGSALSHRKPSFRWAVLAGLFLALVPTAGAVTANVNINLQGGLAGPMEVKLAVSTFPVTNPATAFDSGVYLDSATVFVPATFSSHTFLNLPLLSVPTTYYFYGYVDVNNDSILGSTEPQGGYGPFPYHQNPAVMMATNQNDFGAAVVLMFPRATIEGSVTVAGQVVGNRLIVRANESIANPNPDYEQMVELPLTGGSYLLKGLIPTGYPYRVEAWIDQIGGTMGVWDGNEPHDVIFPGAPVPGGTISSQNLFLAGEDAPDHIRITGIDGSNHQSIVADQPSADLRISIRNSRDELTAASAPVTIFFYGTSIANNFVPDLSIDGAAFQPFAGPLVIASSQSHSVPIRFRSSTSGQVWIRAEAVGFPRVGESRQAWYDFEVFPAGAGFSNVGVRTTSQSVGVLSGTATFTPDGDGVDDGVVFACASLAGSVGWELWISSEPSFGPGVLWRNYGNGPGEVYWHGHGQNGRVPNGTYFARFQTAGQGIVSSTMTVTVQAAAITGVVLDGNSSPVEEVDVNIYSPQGGGFARTTANGGFVVSGLKPLSTYQIELRKTGYLTVRLSTTTGAAADPAVDLGVQTLSQGVSLAVSVAVSSAPSRDIFGGVSVHDPSFTDQQWGSLRIASGATVSDNGRYIGDPQFSTWTLVSVRPDTDYTIEINLPEFGRSTQSWHSPLSGTGYVPFGMTRKANVYGKVRFSAALNSPFNGEWVSVDAQPAGASMPTAWGGVWVNNGMSEGIYTLFGVDPGVYRLRAFARGFVASTATVTVGNGDFGDIATGGADFAPFETGGQITGTLTVSGDSTSVPISNAYGCNAGEFSVYINAWSRTSYMGASSQVCLASSVALTSAPFQISGLSDGTYELYSYLQGFELDTSAGPLRPPWPAVWDKKTSNSRPSPVNSKFKLRSRPAMTDLWSATV
ncbi:MAG: carboxypeptidase regulatory-like domain-containing protein [Elusimicrobia bacterium]|nr:carboxypeptidase regulatory-like domain-containing protein [Elusimicrobiota bacterium]